jgi:hypothetical protein
MPLEINITELKSKDIIKVLNNYPQGHLEIKQNHIFWCSDYLEPENQSRDFPSAPSADGRFSNQRKPNAGEQAARAFKRMSDTLGSMVC